MRTRALPCHTVMTRLTHDRAAPGLHSGYPMCTVAQRYAAKGPQPCPLARDPGQHSASHLLHPICNTGLATPGSEGSLLGATGPGQVSPCRKMEDCTGKGRRESAAVCAGCAHARQWPSARHAPALARRLHERTLAYLSHSAAECPPNKDPTRNHLRCQPGPLDVYPLEVPDQLLEPSATAGPLPCEKALSLLSLHADRGRVTMHASGRQRAPMASLIWANSLTGASSMSGRSLGSMSSSRKSPWSSSVSSVTTLPASSIACKGRSVGQTKQST